MNAPISATHPSIATVVAIGVAIPLVLLLPSLAGRRAGPRRSARTPDDRPVDGPGDRPGNVDHSEIHRARQQLLAIDERYRPSDAEVAAVAGAPLDQVRWALSPTRATVCCADADGRYPALVRNVVADAGNAIAGVFAR